MGVNLFSCIFTAASLIQQGQLMPSVQFLTRHPTAMYNIILLSLFSAVGQLFIYYTVQTFGPLTFTIIMTTRQLISIILSCILYGHVITSLGIVGAAIAFGAVFTQAYLKSRKAGGGGGGGGGSGGGSGRKSRTPSNSGQLSQPSMPSSPPSQVKVGPLPSAPSSV